MGLNRLRRQIGLARRVRKPALIHCRDAHAETLAIHEAARTGVILMDMSFMSKFLVEGRDAGRVLDHISANSVNGATGMITYTQWLNEGGTPPPM